MTFMGINVVVSNHLPPQPALKISPDFEWITDKKRAEVNKWLLDAFGCKEQAVFMKEKNCLIVSPRTFEALKRTSLDFYSIPDISALKGWI